MPPPCRSLTPPPYRTQGDIPTDIAFSSDGTKMFVIGSVVDYVNEYDLSTPFDASTRMFAGGTSIRAQENDPQGMAFSNDGTRMFVIGFFGDDVNEYVLSGPFDVSTSRFIDATPISDQEDFPTGIAFSNDGAKMFVIGHARNNVNEYELSSVYPIVVGKTLPGAFVTTWNVASSQQTIKISVNVISGGDLHVDWGDGDTGTFTADGIISHTYQDSGKYRISMTGSLARINLGNPNSTASNLASIDQWGDIKWSSMANAFRGASNMGYGATDAPDLSGVTSMTRMFYGASSFNGDISSWNVSKVTDMSGMFSSATFFNQPLDSWDVSKVTTMNDMFFHAESFNQPLDSWDVSKVKDMYGMFDTAISFNRPLDSWDVSKVTSMSFMFDYAASFNQNLGEWYVIPVDTAYDVSEGTLSVTTISAQNTVLDGHNPNYGIGSSGDSDLFNMTGNVLMFKATPSAGNYRVDVTAPGGNFGTDNRRVLEVTVTGKDAVPEGAFVTTWNAGLSPHTISIPLEVRSSGTITIDWGDGSNTSVAANGTQSHAYSGPGSYHVSMAGDLSRINLGATGATASKLASIDQWGDVEWSSMAGAFRGASNMAHGATDSPNLSGVSSMQNMFRGASFFDGDLSGWDVSGVANMDGAFRDAKTFNGDISTWNTSGATDMRKMLQNALLFNQDISGWDVSGVIHMDSMFQSASSFNQDISSWNTSGATRMQHMFSRATAFDQPLDSWNVSRVTDMTSMFSFASGFNRPLDSWNVSGVTDMSVMFSGASDFNQPLDSWNVSGVTYMASMFRNAASFNQPLNSWNVSGVTDMSLMFSDASSFNGDISAWNVSKVTYMTSMFYNAGTFDGEISNWNVSRVTYMASMFRNAASFDQPLNSWNVSGVTDMSVMFSGASDFNQPLDSWNVSGVTDMESMFDGATSFDQNLGEWYVIPADTAYDVSEGTLSVTTISAQNAELDRHEPTYGIGSSGDSDLFNMTGNVLMFKATPSAGNYRVDVTAPGGNFGTDNRRVLDVTVTGQSNRPPMVTAGDSTYAYDGSIGRLEGTAFDQDTTDTLTYEWTHDGAPSLGIVIANDTALSTTFEVTGDVESDVTVVFTLTVSDGAPSPVTATVDVTVRDSSGAFITTWKTGAPQTVVSFAFIGTDPIIDWGDGIMGTVIHGVASHTYAEAGQYRVIVDGSVSRLYHTDGFTTPQLLRYVDQWGDINWSSMQSMFVKASNMEYRATDTPDLSNVSSMNSMFDGASSFNWDISAWNVSKVTNMQSMFRGASLFDQSLNEWDVSKVTNMQLMFDGASSFNGDISAWDVSKVTDMAGMFQKTLHFNQSLNEWDVSKVTDMSFMFHTAGIFDGEISDWDVSKVMHMTDMFYNAPRFNQSLNNWNVSSVIAMGNMFSGATDFDQNLGEWYVVLDDAVISGATETLNIRVQNSFLDGQGIVYGLGTGGDSGRFMVNAAAKTLGLNPNDVPHDGTYRAIVTSTGGFGTANHREVAVTVEGIRPAPVPPTFVSSELDIDTGVLTITFSETIDAANIVPAKMHIRESGNYTHGTTLTAGELDTDADGATVSFTLTPSHRAAVAGLAAPELTIEPGAVRDESGNLIVGTFDASTRTFVDATSIQTQASLPEDIAFSNNGTKMFILDNSGDKVHEYDLSSSFDASTRSHVSTTGIGEDESSPRGMTFSNDGTKMFVIGVTGDDVNEYDLSSPFNTSTRTFVNATSIQAQENTPQDIAFSNDGTRMFVIGSAEDKVHEYDLSSPFNASTLSHVNATLISDQETTPTGIAFSNDGTKMFVIGSTEGNVNEYDLSAPFDASTRIFVDATSIQTQEIFPKDVAFSSDGAKMFMTGIIEDNVNEYDLHSVYPITVTDTSTVLPAGAFVTTWNATSSPHTISIPLEVHSSGTITIDWGDGNTTDVTANGIQTHTYSGPGDYQVSMTGDLSRIEMSATGGPASKLASIDQWGDTRWSSMEGAFEDATSMEYNASDVPDLSGVSSMKDMFRYASEFDGDLSGWNVSKVTSMEGMFFGATSFHSDLSGWDVSSVINMNGMFFGVTSFDSDLSGWDVSSVTAMGSMFFGATSFDSDLSGWNVSSVTAMGSMFNGATSFDQNLGEWYVIPADTAYNVSEGTLSVTTISAQNTVLDGHNPNYDIGSSGDSDLFRMTGNALMLKATPSAGNYRVNVTAPGGDFGTDNHRVLDVAVTDKDAVPAGAFVTTWNATSSPHTISIPLEVHSGGTITIDWGDGSTDVVTANGIQTHTYSGPGDYQVSMAGDLSRIKMDVTGGTASKLASIDQWGDIRWSSMVRAFEHVSNMVYTATDAPDLSGVTSMERMFQSASKFDGDLSGWNVSAVTSMERMFQSASKFDGDLSGWNVSAVTNMDDMFGLAAAFNSPLNDWDVSAVTNMASMFNSAAAFNSPLNYWDVSAVTSMDGMFSNAAAFNRPLHNWNVSSVNNMQYMFNGATSFNSTLHNWNVSSVTDMGFMFSNAAAFNRPLNDWNVSSVTDMTSIFEGATDFNQPLHNWDVSSVIAMDNMFSGATAFDQNLGAWYVVAVPENLNIARTDVPGVVGSLSAQSQTLDTHNPMYGIGGGGDSDRFEITGGNELKMISAEATPSYTVNVTASGHFVFESGNNWRTFEVTVTGQANEPPTADAGKDFRVLDGSGVITLNGTASDADSGDTLTYLWSQTEGMPDVTLTNPNTPAPTFTAPDVSSDTELDIPVDGK